MTDKITAGKIDPNLLRRVQGPERVQPGQPGAVQRPKGPAFDQVLAREVARRDIKFSAHALARLQSRNIEMTSERLARLGDAVDRAAAKGAKDSLVLLGDVALVVSVENRTVITAVDGDSIRENVFTNIDSAVIT